VACTWTASTDTGHTRYALLRTGGSGSGRVVFQSPDGLSFADTTGTPGTSYAYRIVSLRADNSVDSHSNLIAVSCC
jgi:hypothetical protein